MGGDMDAMLFEADLKEQMAEDFRPWIRGAGLFGNRKERKRHAEKHLMPSVMAERFIPPVNLEFGLLLPKTDLAWGAAQGCPVCDEMADPEKAGEILRQARRRARPYG